MPNRISKISTSLKQLGEIQVSEWDFMGLLHKDIKDLEITRSLKRLGNIQVMEWDFKTVMPAVNRLANQEVDLLDLVKRTAAYKVMDWDFRSAFPAESKTAPTDLTQAEMQALMIRLENFLQYVVVNLIDQPDHAQIKALEIAPNVLRLKLVLVKRDMLMLVGREGHTATAIRNTLKATAGMHGVHALLDIISHEQEAALVQKGKK